ncbi:hypothetical protein Tco_0499275 [Tanacetum coccineum]
MRRSSLRLSAIEDLIYATEFKIQEMLSPDLGFYNWYQSLVALDLGLIRWQQSGRSEDGRVSSQTLTSKHMDWFTAGFVVPAGLLTVSSASIIGGNLFVLYGDEDLQNLGMINKDFVKRLRSTLEEEGDHYIEPTEFEIQEMVSILSGEAY